MTMVPSLGVNTRISTQSGQRWDLHPTPYTLHPTPYKLQTTNYTLHFTPYTLHPAPCRARTCSKSVEILFATVQTKSPSC